MKQADPQAAQLARMKHIALGLLAAASALYIAATLADGRHPAWGYIAAFAEAAMVGALADWFAVVALFRHPLGLPIPHTAIIPANKARIGAKLAGFICDNFLATPQVLAKLTEFDPADRLARWLSQPVSAQKIASLAVSATRYSLAAFDDERVHAFLGRAVSAGLARLDLARLAGDVLATLTEDRRHQALLDDALQQLARWIDTEAVQEQITDAIAHEIKALRYVGLDQMAARLATRKIVAAVARTIATVAEQPEHLLRQRFDAFTHEFIERLQHDPLLRERIENWRTNTLANPALGQYLHSLWEQLLGWLHDDLERDDSSIGRRIGELAATLGQRLLADRAIRNWINEQITAAAPRVIERYRTDIRQYIEARVARWNTEEMTLELERNIGRDLQFIRINGTLVGGLAGLIIHALTQWLRG